ncbi:casein kinase II subunit beta-like [Aphis gossypii]|uniref:casein kinase II subunit beta-like n=1 Tax=Aphis gossypii TaxID=80765 RepID=UPI002159052F|nr:casein kinase II subunit beta-like [Aphis gossypii]XP_050056377.1 casein kinase II subunit beta-like [Aphis gossypii]XP_050056378.1 casein kinase II subunit beta-like [Aphis gossypii]XP_050056379.1 casein kinase II subunit beta-like [Aphis gossypii]
MNLSPWMQQLLNKPENSFMCAVDSSYVLDKFNLVGLEEIMPDYQTAARVVLQPYSRVAADSNAQSEAELFYGLVHARYVMTPRGIAKILEKYVAGCFGHCPRDKCKRFSVLPIGLSDEVGADTVRIYCPRCTEVYVPPAGTKGAAVDGAYFGTGLPHMVFMTRPEYTPLRLNDRYVAKLYGFRVHDSAYDLQRHEGNEQRRSVQQRAGSTSAAMTTSAGNRAKNSTVTSSILGTTSTAHRLTPPARHHKL